MKNTIQGSTEKRAPIFDLKPHGPGSYGQKTQGSVSSGMMALLNYSQVEELPKGYTLLREGAICKYVYFIERGQLRTFFNKEGREININFSFEKHFVTNLKSFLYSTPSEYFIKTAEPVAIRKYDKKQLLSLSEEFGEIELVSRQILARLFIFQEDHSNLFKLYTPSERYHYVAEYYPKLLQRVSLTQLSSYLGISRETLSRIRKSAGRVPGGL